jgi:hypothetical protein
MFIIHSSAGCDHMELQLLSFFLCWRSVSGRWVSSAGSMLQLQPAFGSSGESAEAAQARLSKYRDSREETYALAWLNLAFC